ncbi:MAG: hypothetical protein MJ214_05170 [Bacilli bacterium]|nr:hypothetical protein [Bacilli bacterium]
MGKKYTLNQIGEDLEKLTKYVIEGFKRVDARIDQIEKRLDCHTLQIEQINKRLDYNNLKQLPERK